MVGETLTEVVTWRVHGKNVINFAPPVTLAPLLMRQVRLASFPRLAALFLLAVCLSTFNQSRRPPRAPLAFLEPDVSNTFQADFLPVPLLALSAATLAPPPAPPLAASASAPMVPAAAPVPASQHLQPGPDDAAARNGIDAPDPAPVHGEP